MDSYMERKAFKETQAGVKGLVDSKITQVPHIFHISQDTLPNNKSSIESTSNFTIPVIDFADIYKKSTSRQNIMEKVRNAAENWGFFQVINHGIPLSVLDEVKNGVRRYHEEDLEIKKRYFSRDYRKSYVYGTNFDLDTSSPLSINWRDTLGCYMNPNPPDPEDIPVACRDAIIDYSKHMMNLGSLVFELLSESLGLELEKLKKLECMKGLLMLLHYYPSCPQPDLTLGTSKHSDNSFLTILLQDQIGGLQVLHQDSWVDVTPVPGALVINVGDFLQMLTNDKFISVEHRVLANKIGPRISVACFFCTSMYSNSTIYGPIKELLSENNLPKYKNFSIDEYSKGYMKKGLDGTSYLSNFSI